MNKILSKKLIFFAFWLIVLVVLLHSTVNVEAKISADNFFGNLQRFISFGLCQVAVPFFFIISGYLFFFKTENIKSLRENILKRKKTLLFPYILWCLIWFLFVFIIQSIPFFMSFFGTPLSSMNFGELMKQIFYYPLNYPFWFLRELILFVLLTPFIYFLSKNKNMIFLIIVFISSFFIKSFITIPSIGISFLKTDALFYFSLGSFIGINKYKPSWKVDRVWVFVMIIIWLLANTLYITLNDLDGFLKILLSYFKNLVGIFALWKLYDFSGLSQKRNYVFYKYSFFIFAFHGIPVNYIAQILKLKLPDTPIFHFGIYLSSFVLVLVMAILLAYSTDKYLNRLYLILTGNR